MEIRVARDNCKIWHMVIVLGTIRKNERRTRSMKIRTEKLIVLYWLKGDLYIFPTIHARCPAFVVCLFVCKSGTEDTP